MRQARPRPARISLGLLALSMLAFPGAAATTFTAGSTTTPSARPCDTLVLPSDEFATLNPVLNYSAVAENAIGLLYWPLLAVDDDGRIRWRESIAKSIVPENGNTRFRVTLRPWHWSDGSALTASDLLYDWSLLRAEGAAYAEYGIGGIPDLVRTIRALDPHTVEIDLAEPVNARWFELDGLSQLLPLPARRWAPITLARQRNLQDDPRFFAVTDGPFRLASFDPARGLAFVPNPHFDGAAPRFRFVMAFMSGPAAVEALRTRGIDAASLPDDLWPAAALLRHDRSALFPSAYTMQLVPNIRNRSVAFFRDVRVRAAIARAIDQERIIRTVYHGHALPEHGFVPTASADLVPPDLGPPAAGLAHDPAEATRLLDASGFRPGPDGIMRRNGRPLAFTLLVVAGDDDFEAEAQLIEDDLRAVGIAMDIRMMGHDQLIGRLYGPSSGWQAVLVHRGGSGYPDAAEFGTANASNVSGYSDPRMDALIARATTEDGTSALFALERAVVAQQPYIFLPEPLANMFARPGLGNLDRAFAAGAYAVWDLTDSADRSCVPARQD